MFTDNIKGSGMFFACVIFVAVVVGQASGQTVGNCNVTFFTTGGLQCQRTMILSLKNDSNLNCSDEYEKESSCLNNHVGSCLQGTLFSSLQSEIVKLPKLLLYHCGSLGYKPSSISSTVLGFVGCNGKNLDGMVSCWDDFRSTFDANRSDPSLCRKFAESKQKCTNIARKSCQDICENIIKDAYNPFCDGTTDPADTSDLFDCIFALGCSNKFIYENAVKCDKSSFGAFADSLEPDCSVVLQDNKDCLRQNLVSQCSAMQKKEDIFEDVVKTLRATMMSQQFFCEKVTLNTSSLHEFVTTADCKPEFFADVETKCAKPFRNIYLNAAEKKSVQVCNAFVEAKICLREAHNDACNFTLNTKQAAMFDEYNPFCADGKDPQPGAASWAKITTLPLLISSFAGLFAGFP